MKEKLVVLQINTTVKFLDKAFAVISS